MFVSFALGTCTKSRNPGFYQNRSALQRGIFVGSPTSFFPADEDLTGPCVWEYSSISTVQRHSLHVENRIGLSLSDSFRLRSGLALRAEILVLIKTGAHSSAGYSW